MLDAEPMVLPGAMTPDASARPDSHPVVEPPRPDAASAWGSLARSVVLSSLLGAALVGTVALLVRTKSLRAFVTTNDLAVDQRAAVLHAVTAGLGAGALVGLIAVATSRRRGWTLGMVERALWFLSPALLLPLLPMLLDWEAWIQRYDTLLPPMVMVVLAAEVLAFRSFRAVPDTVRDSWIALRRALPGIWLRHGPLIVVVAASVGYALFMGYYTVDWHHRLRTHNFDLSINNNLSYTALHGEFMKSRVAMPDDPDQYMAAHVKLGTYVFLPIYALFPRAETLLVIQSALLGLAGIPLFSFGRRHVSPWSAALVSLAYLGYYPMHGANFTEVQYVPHATFFIFVMTWAADVRRWIVCGLAFVAALLMREDVAVGVAVLGTFWLLSGHRPRAGILIAAISTAWFAFLRFYVMDKAGSWWFPTMYKGLFASGETGFGSVIKTLISNPLFTLAQVLTQKKALYLLHVLIPLAFLPARRWYLWAAFVSGGILTLLVTNYDPPITFSFQYIMFWTPYVFLAAPIALAAITRMRDHGKARARAALFAMAFSSTVLSYDWGAFARHPNALKGGFYTIDFGSTDDDRQRYRALRELVALIPKNASVAATENIGPHVSSRKYIYTMRGGPYGARFILASSRELNLGRTRVELIKAVKSKQYGVVARRLDFALFELGHDPSGNDRLMADWNLR